VIAQVMMTLRASAMISSPARICTSYGVAVKR
jgi:hypothetical protein